MCVGGGGFTHVKWKAIEFMKSLCALNISSLQCLLSVARIVLIYIVLF